MPPQFKSKEAAQKEMEDLLSGAREQMAAFGQRVSEGAQQASAGAKDKVKEGLEGTKGYSDSLYEKVRRGLE